MSVVEAVEALLVEQRRFIEVGRSGYWVTAPPLLAQLAEARESSSGGHGGRTVPGSRVPLNLDAAELWFEVATSAGTWAAVLGVDRARYREGRGPIPAVGVLLRAVAANLAGRVDRAALADRVSTSALRWERRITTMLAPDERPGRGLTGVACGECGEAWVVDGESPLPTSERTREPAVRVEFDRASLIRVVWCRACGSQWPREVLSTWADAA